MTIKMNVNGLVRVPNVIKKTERENVLRLHSFDLFLNSHSVLNQMDKLRKKYINTSLQCVSRIHDRPKKKITKRNETKQNKQVSLL